MDDHRKATTYMLISALCFAFVGASVKLAGDLPVFEKAVFRNLFTVPIAFLLLYRSGITGKAMLGKRGNRSDLIMRGILGAAGVITFYYAASNMDLADATMLNRMVPFFTAAFAYVILKERLSKRQIPLIFIAFIAAVLVIKPKFDLSMLPALSAFSSAIIGGYVFTKVRHLNSTEKAETIILFAGIVAIIILLPIALADWKSPTGNEAIGLLGIAIFGAGEQISFTLSYRYGTASEMTAYAYTSIVFALILGVAFWEEMPDTLSMLGGIIILTAGLLLYREKHSQNNELNRV